MEKKTFAFKLADKRPSDTGKWQARDSVAQSTCSWSTHHLQYRYKNQWGIDTGAWC